MDPARTAAEIERLHVVIAAWFRGEGERSDETFERDFTALLHPDFEIVEPSGRVLARAGIVAGIGAAWGTNPDFRIAIEDVRLLAAWPASATCLATYVEAQSGARNTDPPSNRRRSTVLFEDRGGRLIWRHLHETGLGG